MCAPSLALTSADTLNQICRWSGILSQFENLATGDDPTIHFVFIKITELWYLLINLICLVRSFPNLVENCQNYKNNKEINEFDEIARILIKLRMNMKL